MADDEKKEKKTEKQQIDKKKINKNNARKVQEKKSLWVRFRIFCHGVKTEFQKVHWTSKDNMIKYSIATIIFIVICSLFFYAIDIIFALIQTLFN